MAASANRPRVWVPGVAYVTEEGELEVGGHAGFNGRGKGLLAAKCGHRSSIREWRHRAWMVARKDLTPELIEQHAIILPETLLDPDKQPHARRWLAAQPLLCVSGAKLTRLLDDDLRILTVEHGVDGVDMLCVSAEGGGRASWSLQGRVADLLPEELRPEGDDIMQLRANERLEVRSFIDRLLSHISRGVLREDAVVNALAARELVEPGYGYHGATDGVAAPIEAVAFQLRPLEALFDAVFVRADPMRHDAREIARAVKGAPADAKGLDELPIYGSARRVDLYELEIDLEAVRFERAGEVAEELVLPPQVRWFVDRVAMWRPKLPSPLAEEIERSLSAPAPPSPWIAVSLMTVLAAIIAIGYWMTP